MSSQIPAVFASLAKRCNVQEQEFFLLLYEGINTADEFFFRYNEMKALNTFVEDKMFNNFAAYDEGGNLALVPRGLDDDSKEAFNTSTDAACMRRLWTASQQLTKKDMSDMSMDDCRYDQCNTK